MIQVKQNWETSYVSIIYNIKIHGRKRKKFKTNLMFSKFYKYCSLWLQCWPVSARIFTTCLEHLSTICRRLSSQNWHGLNSFEMRDLMRDFSGLIQIIRQELVPIQNLVESSGSAIGLVISTKEDHRKSCFFFLVSVHGESCFDSQMSLSVAEWICKLHM